MTNHSVAYVLPTQRISQGGFPLERIYSYAKTIIASHTLTIGATENFVLFPDHRKFAVFFIRITAVGTGTNVLTVNIQYQDPVSGVWTTIKTLTSAAGATPLLILQMGPNNWPADATPLFYSPSLMLAGGVTRFQGVNSGGAGDSTTYSVGMVQTEAW